MELDAAQPGALAPWCPQHVPVALQGALGLKGSEGPPGPPGPAVSAADDTHVSSGLLLAVSCAGRQGGPQGQESVPAGLGPLWGLGRPRGRGGQRAPSWQLG